MIELWGEGAEGIGGVPHTWLTGILLHYSLSLGQPYNMVALCVLAGSP